MDRMPEFTRRIKSSANQLSKPLMPSQVAFPTSVKDPKTNILNKYLFPKISSSFLKVLNRFHLRQIADSASAEYCSTFQCPLVRRRDISTYIHYMMFKNIQTIHFLKALGPGISKLVVLGVSYTNTQIQIHKNTNTVDDKVPERPNMWYFFVEKRNL